MNELQLTSLESCLQWLPPLAGRTPLPRTPPRLPLRALTEPMKAALHIPGISDGDQDKLVRPPAGALPG